MVQDVESFNKTFSAAHQKLSGPEVLGENVGFRVSRSYDPVFVLDVRLDPEHSTVGWQTSRSFPSRSPGLYIDNGQFEIRIGEDGDGQLFKEGAVVSFTEAAQQLLIPAAEGLL